MADDEQVGLLAAIDAYRAHVVRCQPLVPDVEGRRVSVLVRELERLRREVMAWDTEIGGPQELVAWRQRFEHLKARLDAILPRDEPRMAVAVEWPVPERVTAPRATICRRLDGWLVQLGTASQVVSDPTLLADLARRAGVVASDDLDLWRATRRAEPFLGTISRQWKGFQVALKVACDG